MCCHPQAFLPHHPKPCRQPTPHHHSPHSFGLLDSDDTDSDVVLDNPGIVDSLELIEGGTAAIDDFDNDEDDATTEVAEL